MPAKGEYRNDWCKGEMTLLRRLHGWHSYATIATSLREIYGTKRTYQAISMKASRLGLGHRIPPGWVPLVDAMPQQYGGHTGANARIIAAAKREGVARQRLGMPGRPWLAPEAWVDKFMGRLSQEEWEGVEREYILREWWPSQQVAEYMGVPSKNVTKLFNHTRGWWAKHGPTIRRKHMRNANHQPYYWHPDDVRRVVQLWREREL